MSVKIMSAVWELDLPPDEKIVLLAFADHADDEGVCFPAVARVAWKCAYSVRSVQNKIAKLKQIGLLVPLANENGGKPGSSTLYRVVPEAGHVLPAYTGAKAAPVDDTGAEPGETGAKSSDSDGGGVQTSAPEPSVTTQPSVKQPSPGELRLKAEKEAPTWMHALWTEMLGNGRTVPLTADRRDKYRAMYREQLARTSEPHKAWKLVLRAVQVSSHHMSDRGYQMPESLLLNPERRSTWIERTFHMIEKATTHTDAAERFAADYRARNGHGPG